MNSMEKFVTFRHKSNGVVRSYPEHYENHPVFGADLERYTPGDSEYEEDKVVVNSHEVPAEQRATRTATPKAEKSEEKPDTKTKDN